MASPRMALSARPLSGSQPRVGVTPVVVLPRGRPRLLSSRRVSLPGLGGPFVLAAPRPTCGSTAH
eukprot:10747377-Alexandrium_andersonii.AAC.1